MGRILSILIALAIIVGGLWAGAWYAGQALIGRALEDALVRQTRQGVTITLDDAGITGAPERWRIGPTAATVSIRGPDAMDLAVRSVSVESALLDPLRLVGTAEGVVADLPPALPILARPYLSIAGVDIETGLTWDGRPRFADVRARDLVLGEDTLRIARAATARLQLRRRAVEGGERAADGTAAQAAAAGDPGGPAAATGEILSIAGDVTRLTLPTGLALPFGPEVQEVAALTDLPQPWPEAVTAPALARWQAAGGTLEVREARLIWDDFRLTLSGVLTLDPMLQPEGTLQARIAGVDRVLDWMAETGQVTESNARAIRFGLQLISRMGEDGRRIVVAPLVIGQGQIRLGPLPIATLPPIVWPAEG